MMTDSGMFSSDALRNTQRQKEHLHLWQKRNFPTKGEVRLSPSSLAEIHRNNICQIYAAIRGDNVDEGFAKLVLNEETDSYFKIIDDSDSSKGLNNMAEQALAIASGFKNKSEEWESGLTCESVMKLKCVQDLVGNSSECDKALLSDIENKGKLKLLQETPTQKPNMLQQGNGSFKPFNGQPLTLNKQDSCVSVTTHKVSAFAPDSHKSKRRKYDDNNDDIDEDAELPQPPTCFKSAREQLAIDQKKKFQRGSPQGSSGKKSLGSRPRNQCFSKFIPPSNKEQKDDGGRSMLLKKCVPNSSHERQDEIDPKLKGIEPQLIELVMSEIMDHGPPIGWDDIAGLEFAKATIKEIVIWPMLRPDIFTGLRGPPKGILLFGPPGTGKTLIGKCIANQSGATFFSISASSLTSKWIGQAEKMVRALFAVANLHQPAVIFIDEIDSLLSQRSDSEHESSRRIKTEFFVQLDGATTSSEDRILVVGATNRPQEIDEAARRRLVKRLYIPLPDDGAREQIITNLLKQQPYSLSQEEILTVVERTDGYSGADVTNLCKDAALGPIRSLQVSDISRISKDDVRAINLSDFEKSLQRVKASVSKKDLSQYEEWNKIFGCGSL